MHKSRQSDHSGRLRMYACHVYLHAEMEGSGSGCSPVTSISFICGLDETVEVIKARAWSIFAQNILGADTQPESNTNSVPNASALSSSGGAPAASDTSASCAAFEANHTQMLTKLRDTVRVMTEKGHDFYALRAFPAATFITDTHGTERVALALRARATSTASSTSQSTHGLGSGSGGSLGSGSSSGQDSVSHSGSISESGSGSEMDAETEPKSDVDVIEGHRAHPAKLPELAADLVESDLAVRARWDAWLADETQSLGRYLQRAEVQAASEIDNDVGHIHLCVEPSWRMPAPLIVVSIPLTQQNLDLNDKPYTVFCICVRQGELQWQVQRRYSDFHALHAQLGRALAQLKAAQARKKHRSDVPMRLPPMPAKRVFGNNLDERFISQRKAELQDFLQQLVALPFLQGAADLLEFLGMMSMSRSAAGKHVDTRGMQRDVIHVSQLRHHARAGDLILFKCKNRMSGLQRKVTGSSYDHVGLVVTDPYDRRSLSLLEATGDGVSVLSLVPRIRAYATEFTKLISLRRIHAPSPSDDAAKSVEQRMKEERALRSSSAHSSAADSSCTESHVDDKFSGVSTVGGPRVSDSDERYRSRSWRGKSRKTVPPHLQQLATFVKEVDGKPYRLSARKILRTQFAPRKGSANKLPNGNGSDSMLVSGDPTTPSGPSCAASASDAHNEYEDFFCSELIAAGLKRMGCLQTEREDAYFWPSSFAQGGDLEKYMGPGFSYGEEIVIDCNMVEVEKAQVMGAPSPSRSARATARGERADPAGPRAQRVSMGMGTFKLS